MSPEQFREIGHSLVDSIANFFGELPRLPTATGLMPDSLRAVLGQRDLPEEGTDVAPVLEEFSQKFFDLRFKALLFVQYAAHVATHE